ncbi:MAG: hypothetical protein ABWZ19_05185 [Hyphomicrobium sp.]
MRKWLSIIALACALAMGFGAYAPGARAAALTSDVLALKGDRANIVEKARYRCWWSEGYRRCGYRHGWRHRYGRHYGWRHRYWRHHGWRHHGWRHRGWRYRQWQRERAWRQEYYQRQDYPYRRHYYYNSYNRPVVRPRAGGYCIGLCWW